MEVAVCDFVKSPFAGPPTNTRRINVSIRTFHS